MRVDQGGVGEIDPTQVRTAQKRAVEVCPDQIRLFKTCL